jgi:hypothetical protein
LTLDGLNLYKGVLLSVCKFGLLVSHLCGSLKPL